MSKVFDVLTTEDINIHGSKDHIVGKNRKRKAQWDAVWKEVWLENLEKYGITDIKDVRKADESPSEQIQAEIADGFLDGEEISANSETKLREILIMIRQMADNPEKLFESHLGIFIDPAPPGKLLNSKG